jgi:hydrogenase-1 operon protein HyaF
MKGFPIPVVAWGPGSQPADQDFDYVAFPSVEPLPEPMLPSTAAADDCAAAADVVDRLLEAMRRRDARADAPRFSLMALAPGAREVLNEALGQGEVSVKVDVAGDRGLWRIQETAFPGVWRVRLEDARGRVLDDLVEAGEMPSIVKDACAGANIACLDATRLPAGVINARPVVHELRHHARGYRAGTPAHVVNLSLLPFAPEDHAGLDMLLGEGPVSILSRGFGNCRIASTRAANVWRVRFYNVMSTIILDTLEVVDIPEAARAAAEDLDESRDRLSALLEWMREQQ